MGQGRSLPSVSVQISIWRSTESTIHVITVAAIATPKRPSPIVTPIADVIQIPAAVVSPRMLFSLSRFRIAPAPRKPMPVTSPWMTRDSAGTVHAPFHRRDDEQRRAGGDEDMRAQSGRLSRAFALHADDGAAQQRDHQAQHRPDEFLEPAQPGSEFGDDRIQMQRISGSEAASSSAGRNRRVFHSPT